MLINGPLVTEFNAGDEFSMYQKGIMTQQVKPPEVLDTQEEPQNMENNLDNNLL